MKIKNLPIFIITLMLCFLSIPYPASDTPDNGGSPDHIVINEFAFNTADTKARWIEFYNPTSIPINLSGWVIVFPGAFCMIPSLPAITIQPGGYAVLTPSIDNFTAYWKISASKISLYGLLYEGEGFPSCSHFYLLSNMEDIVDCTGDHSSGVFLPEISLNHSFARYRSGYDTNNFTNDFYDEPYPTPGYENHWEKPKLDITHSPNSRNVTLYWNYTVNPDIRKYNLLVSSLPSFPQNATNTIEILDTNISSYEFTNLSDGKCYFKLRVYNSTGAYAESNVVDVTIPQPPSPPVNLTTTLSDSKVRLTWEAPLSDGNAPITEYKIYRGTSEDSLEFIASVNGSVNEYLDSNVTKGEKYYYAVSAVNPLGEGNMSEIVSIEIPKEKEQVPSIGFAGIIGVIAIAIYIKYRRKREK